MDGYPEAMEKSSTRKTLPGGWWEVKGRTGRLGCSRDEFTLKGDLQESDAYLVGLAIPGRPRLAYQEGEKEYRGKGGQEKIVAFAGPVSDKGDGDSRYLRSVDINAAGWDCRH